MTEGLSDAALDARLDAHFESQAASHPVPDFDVQMARATERVQPRHRRRVGAYGTAAVATFAVVAILLGALRKEPAVLDAADLDAADRHLVTELTASTTWHAPSDGWLATTSLEILSMPNFDDMTYETGLKRSAVGGV